jgi:hypothetical protein
VKMLAAAADLGDVDVLARPLTKSSLSGPQHHHHCALEAAHYCLPAAHDAVRVQFPDCGPCATGRACSAVDDANLRRQVTHAILPMHSSLRCGTRDMVRSVCHALGLLGWPGSQHDQIVWQHGEKYVISIGC